MAPASAARAHARHGEHAVHHLSATQVTAIHAELRAAARAAQRDLDVTARTDLYAGLAAVALMDHLRGGRVTSSTLRSLARHSATARDVDGTREQR